MRLLPLLAAVVLGMIAAAPPSVARADARGALRLMTYNVDYGNTEPEATLDAIAAADADVVLLQEITAEWQRALIARFAQQYPTQVFRIHTRAAGGLAVLSKLPIHTEEVIASPERGWYPAERLVIEAPFGAVQVLNVHLRPPIDGGSWVRGFLTTRPRRRREIETYWRKLARDLPTIVAGDFNEDPTGGALAFLVQHGLARVPTEGPRTWRYVTTVRGKTAELLKLDVDHVMIDRSLEARDARVLEAGTSDHRPVVVTIEPSAGRAASGPPPVR